MSERTPGIDAVREHIDRHFAEPLTVDDLAAVAGLSTFHFIRTFHAAVGETPHQYLRRKRLEYAQHLLVTTMYQVTEICDRIGFQSLGRSARCSRE